jgi:hypothetical protein
LVLYENISHDVGVHPITATSERYCLADNFHKRNLSSEKDLLRDPALVPQLKNILNTQGQEQIFRSFVRDIYYIDAMTPAHYLFCLRLKIHLWNEAIKQKQLCDLKNRSQTLPGTSTSFDTTGRIYISYGEYFLQKYLMR